MKRPVIILCTAVALFTSPVLAQEDMGPPKPAKELEKFSRLIGYWKGEGTAKHSPDEVLSLFLAILEEKGVLDTFNERAGLRMRLAICEDTLKHYAEKSNWESRPKPPDPKFPSFMDKDRGGLARFTLDYVRGPKGSGVRA